MQPIANDGGRTLAAHPYVQLSPRHDKWYPEPPLGLRVDEREPRRSKGTSMSRKLTPRQVIARSYPSWDYAMADRLIAWLDDCGYEIVEKDSTRHLDASLVPEASDAQEQLRRARAH
jgi:hypothetical protein